MTTLNLETKNQEQERIKAYLEANASDILAEKINNGVPIVKNGTQLVNKKTLAGFMDFAGEEARKAAEKGARSVCIDYSVVFGWAVHYFEEDSIEGKLYNLDGTEYKPPAPVRKEPKPYTPPKPVEPPKPKQPNLFDLIAAAGAASEQPKAPKPEEQVYQVGVENDPVILDEKAPEDNDGPSIDEICDSLQAALDAKNGTAPPPEPKKNDLFEQYSDYALQHPDSVVIMRVGDFYEIFGKNAVELAKRHDLTLTGRTFGEQRIPIIGVPYHAADIYFSRFRKYKKLFIVEPDGTRTIPEYGLEDIIDGSVDDIDDDLSVEEMREYDGDMDEPEEDIQPPPTLTAADISMDTDILKRLHEIFGDVLA